MPEGVDSISRGRNIITTLYVVVLTWAIISVYFFCQHYITVKTYDVNEKIVLKEAILFIKQVTMEQYHRKAGPYDPSDAWYGKVTPRLPEKAKVPFLKFCNFYSRPYEFQADSAVVKIKGIMAYDSANILNLRDQYKIYIYNDKANYFGRSMAGGGGKNVPSNNVYLFYVFGKEVPPDIKQLKLVIEKKRDQSKPKVLSLEPKWETDTYNTLRERKPRYEFDPEILVSKMYHSFRVGNTEQLEDFVLPEQRDNFHWERMEHEYWDLITGGHFTYIKEYQSFEDVFKYSIVFSERDNSENDNIAEQLMTHVAKQNLYLIDTGEEWRIIDVDPMEELLH